MIVVKTRMRKVPDACVACTYYMSRNDAFYDNPACAAIGGYGGYGKQINRPTKPSIERPRWCPLRCME